VSSRLGLLSTTNIIQNDQAGQTLVVSSLTNGCLNIDTRRAAGDQVLLFSCGGRADGEGGVTNSQLFTFPGGETSLALASDAGKTCVVNNAGKLDQNACSGDANQLFTIG